MVTKTNPAYAHLAFRKAILTQIVTLLRDDYMPLSADQPNKQILCEDVFREDEVVPAEAVQDVIHDLEQEIEHTRLELTKFTFKRQESHGLFQHKKTKKTRP